MGCLTAGQRPNRERRLAIIGLLTQVVILTGSTVGRCLLDVYVGQYLTAPAFASTTSVPAFCILFVSLSRVSCTQTEQTYALGWLK